MSDASAAEPAAGEPRRPLHLIWLVDCSGSMSYGGKIQALNTAVREALPHLRRMADELPDTELLVRAVRFGSGAEWHVAEPTPIEQFEWRDLGAAGFTDLGQALSLVASAFASLPMPVDALAPVVVLVTDGRPTDDFEAGLAALVATPCGERSIRLAIAIGHDVDQEILEQFMSGERAAPLHADSPEELAQLVRAVATNAVLAATGRGAGRRVTSPRYAIPIPEDLGDGNGDDVW